MALRNESDLVATVAHLLRLGRPTPFRYEGAAIQGLRAGFCLEGNNWHHADILARMIVMAALDKVAAIRPSWLEGQPEWTQEGFAPVERWFCERCSAPIPAATNTNGIPKKYCSRLCHDAAQAHRARNYYEQQSRASYLASMAARSERTKRERAKECQGCGKVFLPDGRRKKEQLYCSRACSPRPRKLADRQCKCCGQTFRPKNSTVIYCSRECWRNGVAERRRQKQDDYRNALAGPPPNASD